MNENLTKPLVVCTTWKHWISFIISFRTLTAQDTVVSIRVSLEKQTEKEYLHDPAENLGESTYIELVGTEPRPAYTNVKPTEYAIREIAKNSCFGVSLDGDCTERFGGGEWKECYIVCNIFGHCLQFLFRMNTYPTLPVGRFVCLCWWVAYKSRDWGGKERLSGAGCAPVTDKIWKRRRIGSKQKRLRLGAELCIHYDQVFFSSCCEYFHINSWVEGMRERHGGAGERVSIP
jgi:hypothetical protein